MQFVIDDLIAERTEGGTIIEESPVKSSGSNGIVEKTAQDVEGRIRAIFLGLQERLKRLTLGKDQWLLYLNMLLT